MTKYSEMLLNDNLVIFLLHGVIDQQKYFVRNYTHKHISQEFFYNFISHLSKLGTPLSMDDVVQYSSNKKKFPKKSFVITFDDGFENNYSIACPILKIFNIPATLYITTRFIDENLMSWIDRIEYVVELSESGSIDIDNQCLFFDDTVTSKIKFLENIRKILKVQKNINLDQFATKVQEKLGFKQVCSSNDKLYLKMNWEQVKSLAEDPLFIIGGHTHTHPVLSNLNDELAKYEIDYSLDLIHKKTGLRCKHYSYPEGMSSSYTSREINMLKQNGIICSPSAEEGHNSLGTNLFHLKRIMVT